MKIDIKNRKKYRLIMVGRGNFNLYHCLEDNFIYSVAKTGELYKGCEDSHFGSIDYFNKWFNKEFKKDNTLDGTLTAYGFKVLGL